MTTHHLDNTRDSNFGKPKRKLGIVWSPRLHEDIAGARRNRLALDYGVGVGLYMRKKKSRKTGWHGAKGSRRKGYHHV